MTVMAALGVDWPLVLISCFLLLAFLAFLVMCVCHSNSKEARKSSPVVQDTSAQPDQVTVVMRNDQSSPNPCNGSARDGRPVSHDRALPEIPHNDDETVDDDDGNYDIIARTVKTKEVVAEKSKNSNPYEPVSSEDVESSVDPNYDIVRVRDPPYSGIKDRDPPYSGIKDKDPPYSGIKEQDPPYSGIKDQDPLYSGIKDRDPPYSGIKEEEVKAQVASPPREAVYAQIDEEKRTHRPHHQRTTSSGSNNAPPVPEKNLGPFDGPRPAIDLDSIPYADATPSSPVRDVASAIEPLMNPQPVVSTTAQAERRKEPPYSKVTARESLDALRRREQAQAVTYDTINYDEIKSMPARHTMPPNALTGPYATITGVKEDSRPSSTYAHIQDVPDGKEPPQPLMQPLPYENENSTTRSRHSSDEGYNTVGEVGNAMPVYAQVDKKRNQDVNTQLYAQVDKNRKSKKESQPAVLPLGAGDPIEDPDYDTVEDSVTKVVVRNTPAVVEGDYESLPNSGVATVIRTAAAASAAQAAPKQWIRREHVYEEIRDESIRADSHMVSSPKSQGDGDSHMVSSPKSQGDDCVVSLSDGTVVVINEASEMAIL